MAPRKKAVAEAQQPISLAAPGKKAPTEDRPVIASAETPRPRLKKLTIRNFRCIGETPVEIELDDIVVLVGPNNAGKSSILRAYELIMSQGSKAGLLSIEEFPMGVVTQGKTPTIELETVVFDNAPGDVWIATDSKTGESVVRERWTWSEPGIQPSRQGWLVSEGRWDDRVPWGAPNVANSRRPEAHRIDAFASPEAQATEIVNLLTNVLKERVKELTGAPAPGKSDAEANEYSKLLKGIGEIQRKIVDEAATQVKDIEDSLSKMIGDVFPDHRVRFDARPEEELDKCVTLFKAAPQLRMGPREGHQCAIEQQGSGARRTLLWAALRILSERKQQRGAARPHVLLLDEPEICLHPSAVRDACRVLYDLPQKATNWQVMITTHSPVFIDLSRDNTSIVRVERRGDGVVVGTTLFRPKRAQLDEDDKALLKLLNVCDPYVSEFFFGGRTIVVEGDTEYTAFKHVMSKSPERFHDVHVVRARGKACIVSVCKVLNQFGADYAVLHDSDTKTIVGRKSKKSMRNPAWSMNETIKQVAAQAPSSARVRVVASVPNFEGAFFGEEAEDEKPYGALVKLRSDGEAYKRIEALLEGLLDRSKPLPGAALAWTSIEQLDSASSSSTTLAAPSPQPS